MPYSLEQTTQKHSHSIWLDGLSPSRDCLTENKSSKIVIVGGSFTGLSTAYHLLLQGYLGSDISIIEKGYIGQEAGRSAGLLAKSTESNILRYVYNFGEKEAKQVWESQREGIELIVNTIKKHALKCGFESKGSRLYATKEETAYLEEEAEARNRFGFKVEIRHHPSLGEQDTYLFDPSDCTINPAALCTELSKYLEGEGVKIYENTKAYYICNKATAIYSDHGILKADKIVLAGQRVPQQFRKGGTSLPIETYCLTTRRLRTAEIVSIGLHNRQIFWDSDIPFFYGKLTPDNRLLVGGGDLFLPLSKLFSKRKRKQLKDKLMEYFPQLSEEDINYEWSGIMHIKSDFLPVIGNDGNIFYAGTSAGIQHAVLSGKVVADKIAGKKTQYDTLFDPNRKVSPVPITEFGLLKNMKAYLHSLGF